MPGDKSKTGFDDFDPAIDPFTGEPILSREEMDALGHELQTGKQHKQTLEEQERELRAEGWKTLAEAQEITGLDSDRVLWRRAKMLRDGKSPMVWDELGSRLVLVHPDQVEEWLVTSQQENAIQRDDNWMRLDAAAEVAGLNYMAAYKRADKAGEGSVWKHPHAQAWYVRRDMVEQWRVVGEKEAELVGKGYLIASQIAERTGLPKESMVQARITGLSKANSPHIWTNPYSRKVYVAPEIVEEWMQLSEKIGAVKAREMHVRDTGYVTLADAADIIGIPRDTLAARTQKIMDDKIYHLAGGDFRGSELVVKLDMLTTKNAPTNYIHPALLADWKIAEENRRELSTKGWIDIGDAEKIAGGSFTRTRLLRMDPNQMYTARGYEAKEGDPAYAGRDLVFVDSAGSLLSPLLVESLKLDGELSSQLKEKGYLPTTIVAKQLGISIPSVMQRVHRHSYIGTTANDGSPFVCRDPTTKEDVLFHPTLVAEWLGTKNIVDDAGTKLAQGYKTSAEVARDTGLTPIIMSTIVSRIIPDADYSFAAPNSGIAQQILKGSDLVYVVDGPHVSRQILIHPLLAASIAQEEQTYLTMKERGFQTIAEASAQSSVKISTVANRVRSIRRQAQSSHGPDDTISNLSTDVWHHRYSDKKILIDPKLVEQWKDAEQKRAELIGLGYVTQNQAAEEVGITSALMSYRIKAMQANAGNEAGIWRNPYGTEMLVAPNVVDSLRSNAAKPIASEASGFIHTGKVVETGTRKR